MEGKAALVVFSVKDPVSAADLYEKLLNTEPYVKSPYYSGFKQGDFEIGLAMPDPRRDGAPLVYLEAANLTQRIKELTAAGATLVQEPTEVGGGLQIAVLKDADGNSIGLRQAPT